MMKYLALFIIIISITPACNKPGCVGKAGAIATLQAPLGGFTGIRLSSNIDLVLVQGISNGIEIKGPGNIIPEISYKIVDGLLMLNNEAACRWARDPDEDVKVRLTFTSLNRLEYEGSGNVTNEDTLRLDALLIESYEGAGDVELTLDNKYTGVFSHLDNPLIRIHGMSDQCNTYTSARGITDLSDFRVSKMVIEYGGLGDTNVQVTDELNAIIYYKGNVFYKGSPVITKLLRYSTGDLIRRP